MFGAPASTEHGRARPRTVVVYLLGVAGLAASVTLVFLAMRAVMDIGGACADGGPFVSARPCPEGVPLLMILGMFGLFGFGGLGLVAGGMLGGWYGAVPLLGWPGLFLSLGWNFIEYGLLAPRPGEGIVWGWLVPGVLFWLMGGVPLILAAAAWRGDRAGARVPERFGLPRLAAGAASGRGSTVGSAARSRPEEDVVTGLERLAALRDRGDLSAAEFEAAKRALLRDAGEAV